MYEEGNDIPLKKGVFSFVEHNNIVPLDPTFENVVDIQELLNTATALEAEEGPINLDHIFPASDLELVEKGHTSEPKTRSDLPSDVSIRSYLALSLSDKYVYIKNFKKKLCRLWHLPNLSSFSFCTL